MLALCQLIGLDICKSSALYIFYAHRVSTALLIFIRGDMVGTHPMNPKMQRRIST